MRRDNTPLTAGEAWELSALRADPGARRLSRRFPRLKVQRSSLRILTDADRQELKTAQRERRRREVEARREVQGRRW